jgi:hypothetical protein
VGGQLKNQEKSPICIAGGLELIFVATKSKISRSILKIIAGWDRTGWKALIYLIQKSLYTLKNN